MSSPNHPYAKSPPSKVATKDEGNVSMCDNSPSSKASESKESKQTSKDNNHDDKSSCKQDSWAAEEEIDFKESHFQIPPPSAN